MLYGHGDDLYQYPGVRMNFSSNIPSFVDISPLEEHLRRRMSVIRSYPEPSPLSLEAKIAHSIGINAEEVLVTSGATEAIYLIAQTAHALGIDTYTVVHPTFSEYDSACRMFGLRETEEGSLCWLCNPNNPTGSLCDEDGIRALAARHRWLVIDQSYEHYALSPLPQVDDQPNIITLHSMTKHYCIPGLRLGYITAPAPVIAQLRRLCRPWSVNALALEAGHWLMDNFPQWLDRDAYLQEAQRLRMALDALPGIDVRPTQTNFMLCRIASCTAAELKEYLARRHGTLIRDASNFPGLTPHHFRVAAQRRDQNDALVQAIKRFITTDFTDYTDNPRPRSAVNKNPCNP